MKLNSSDSESQFCSVNKCIISLFTTIHRPRTTPFPRQLRKQFSVQWLFSDASVVPCSLHPFPPQGNNYNRTQKLLLRQQSDCFSSDFWKTIHFCSISASIFFVIFPFYIIHHKPALRAGLSSLVGHVSFYGCIKLFYFWVRYVGFWGNVLFLPYFCCKYKLLLVIILCLFY